MCICRLGLEGDGSLEVCECGGQISPLPQDEAEQVVRARMIVVEAEPDPGSGEVRHASVYRTARRLFQGEVLFS